MATKTKEVVIYSDSESTIHVLAGEPETFPDGTVQQAHESKLLMPGETITLDEVPSYLVDLIKEGKAIGLRLLDKDEADKLNEFAKLARGEGKVTDFIDAPDPVLPDPLVGPDLSDL